MSWQIGGGKQLGLDYMGQITEPELSQGQCGVCRGLSSFPTSGIFMSTQRARARIPQLALDPRPPPRRVARCRCRGTCIHARWLSHLRGGGSHQRKQTPPRNRSQGDRPRHDLSRDAAGTPIFGYVMFSLLSPSSYTPLPHIYCTHILDKDISYTAPPLLRCGMQGPCWIFKWSLVGHRIVVVEPRSSLPRTAMNSSFFPPARLEDIQVMFPETDNDGDCVLHAPVFCCFL